MNKLWYHDDLHKAIRNETDTSIINYKNSSIIVSEHGARILGLFPSQDYPDTLFVPPDVALRIKSNDWLLGGERQWIAPQQSFFFTNPVQFDGFNVQNCFDPGKYQKKGDLHYENNFTLTNYNTNSNVNNCISRRVFKYIEKDPFNSGLCFAGVSTHEYLLIPDSKHPYCAWSIAMMSTNGSTSPGTIFFPSSNTAHIVPYFNNVPGDRFSINNNYGRFLIDSKDPYKLATSPKGIDWNNPVKIAYAAQFPNSDKWYCVAKCSDDIPDKETDCVDVPSRGKFEAKGAIQGYNHGYGSELLYGEIELQFTKGQEKKPSQGKHDLLSYIGSKTDILDLLRILLRCENVQVY